MSKIKAVVIGLGMGRQHVKQYVAHPDVDVVALCDLNEDLGKRFCEEHGIRNFYTDIDTLFARDTYDLVSVALPNALHKDVTIRALEEGAHVLCEKPLAMSTAEAEIMVERARELDKRLAVNFSFRYHGASHALYTLARAGEFGDIYHGSTWWLRRGGIPKMGGWFTTKALSGGGPLIDLAVHRLDFALALMGYPEPVSVLAATHDHLGREKAQREGCTFDVEDLGAAMIRFANGASLQLETSWDGYEYGGESWGSRLLGTRGGCSMRGNEGFIVSKRHGVITEQQIMKPYPGPSSVAWQFADAIRDGTPHHCTGEEGVALMRLLDGIYASAASGREFRFDQADAPQREESLV